jgi:hypothetical protein
MMWAVHKANLDLTILQCCLGGVELVAWECWLGNMDLTIGNCWLCDLAKWIDSLEKLILQISQIVTRTSPFGKVAFWEVGKVKLQNSWANNIHILWMSIHEISFMNLQWMNYHG